MVQLGAVTSAAEPCYIPKGLCESRAGTYDPRRRSSQEFMTLPYCISLCLALASFGSTSLVAQSVPGSVSSQHRVLDKLLDKTVLLAQQKLMKETDFVVDHSEWENAWEVNTTHYTVRTTQSYAYAQQVGQGLETMLGYYRLLLKSDFVPTERFKVFILPSIEAYRAFGNSNGAHHSSIHGSYYARDHAEKPVACYYDSNQVLVNMHLTHAAVHQFVEQAFGRAPATWIDEGLASYFSLFWANDWGVQELKRIKDEETYRPLNRLMVAAIGQYGAATAQASFMELGMFFTYLLIWREDTKTIYGDKGEEAAPFADYIRRSVRGQSVVDLPIHKHLTKGLRELELEFKAFEFPLKAK